MQSVIYHTAYHLYAHHILKQARVSKAPHFGRGLGWVVDYFQYNLKLFVTTLTLEKAMSALASMGEICQSRPKA